MTLTNGQIAELLARAEQDEAPGTNRRTALHRASRAALFWPEEAHALAEAGPLTELRSVGPWLAGVIAGLLASAEPPPDPPEARAGFLTLAEVRATLREHPEWAAELRSDLQMHTTYSDGRASLREMARACFDDLGYHHILITDHSKGLPIARGMDEARLAAESAEVAALDRELAALAGEAGVWISIGTDAHHPRELANMEFGLAIAIRAGIPRDRILNYLPVEELLAWAADRE